jgi:hypothetical protein
MIPGLATALLAIGCSTPIATDEEVEWHEIREESSLIVFTGPGLQGGTSRFYRGVGDRSFHYVGRWVGPSGRFPVAEIAITRIGGDALFTMKGMRGPEYSAARTFEGRVVRWGARSSTQNALGDIDYALFSLEDAECVAFSQLRREASVRSMLRGHYCAEVLTEEVIRDVLNGITGWE